MADPNNSRSIVYVNYEQYTKVWSPVGYMVWLLDAKIERASFLSYT
jgi:hypothetical protein